ncbi:MAG: hypothetical protein JWN45_3139 [Acidobacteriaceae bacterium]|nr:hypothetical protein [Acidobacteriaceae bacterium]
MGLGSQARGPARFSLPTCYRTGIYSIASPIRSGRCERPEACEPNFALAARPFGEAAAVKSCRALLKMVYSLPLPFAHI